MEKTKKRNMRVMPRIRWGALLLEVLTAVLVSAFMILLFIGAALQESYRLAPPTAEELADDPSLARYLPEGSQK